MTDVTDPAHFAAMRHAMVASQLRTSGVNDPRVVEVMAQVPRERFVPAEQARFAYGDTGVPLPGGRRLNPPLATGRLLTAAELMPTDHVLLVGAAGGYTAAVLAKLAASVVAVEPDPTLAADARAALAGEPAVTVIEGPLEAGAADHGPYDVLVIDGAVEAVPETLAEQVAPGGRIVSGIVDRGVTRLAAGRRSAGGFRLVDFLDIDCAVLPGFARPKSFSF